MDFDKYLTRVQTSLKCIEKRAGIKFIDRTELDGIEKEDKSDNAVHLFTEFLKELNPGANDLRHIHLYLLINTDFEFSYLLENDINFCHLFNTIPRISSHVYFEFINSTDMYQYLGEIILFCPEVVTVDVLKCISVNLRNIRLEIANKFLYVLYEGLFKKIIVLQETNKENIKQKFVKIFQKFCEFSIFDLIEKSNWELVRRQCFLGRYIKTLLALIENCTKMFNSGCSFEKMALYEMKTDYDYNSWTLMTKQNNWPVYCLHVMIGKCKRVLKQVNVDIYMAWCEEEYVNESVSNLQVSVRQAAYTCKETLNTLVGYKNEIADLSFLIKDLEGIAVKPKTEDDEVTEANTETIARHMKDPTKTQLKWLQSYLRIENILLENRCVDDLKSVTGVFTKTTTLELIGTFTKHLACGELQGKSVEAYKEIITSCVKNLIMEEQLEILNDVASDGSDTLKTSNFNHNATETLNKLVSKSDNMDKVMQDIIILALESGRELVTLMMADCLKAPNLCDLYIQILCDLPLLAKYSTNQTECTPLCQHLITQHFNNALKTEVEYKESLVYMIKKLSYYNIIDGKDFIINNLIVVIQNNVPAKKWKDVDLCLDVFEVFIDGSAGAHVTVSEAEMIAFFATLLNKSRLQPPQFTIHSADVMQKTNRFLFTLTNHFLQNKKNGKTDSDMCWLRDKVKNMSPLTWFPMRKLWSGMELPPDPNDQLICFKQNLGRKDLLDMKDQERGVFVVKICKILPLLSISEWKIIGFELGGAERAPYCVEVFHILADSLLVLNQLPVIYGKPECMAHLISGLTNFFKAKAHNALKHSDRTACLTALNKQIILANELCDEVIKLRIAAIASVLQDMVSLIIEKASKDQQQSDLLTTIASLKEVQIQSMLSNMLLKSLSA